MSRNDYYSWLKDKPDNVCPFCEYEKYQLILSEGIYWVWIACKSPYWGYHSMLIPKRHVNAIDELKTKEREELFTLQGKILRIYLSAELFWPDGTAINNYMAFWRQRKANFDPLIGADKLSHFHLHFVPEKEHSWDDIMNPDAHLIDLEPLLTSIRTHDNLGQDPPAHNSV